MTRGRGRVYMLAAMLAMALAVAAPHGALAQEDKAGKVKSVFMFKFFDYVTWPPGRVPGQDGDAVLCTYGSRAFDDTLAYIAARKSGSVRFRLRPVAGMEDSGGCHVLYVAEGKYGEIAKIQPGGGIMTIGDGDGFLASGGVLQMKEDGGKVRLLIDLNNARKNGLKISSRLLDIAEVSK